MPLLRDVSVLEWGRGIAAAYASKLLGDLGAEVIVTPREGRDPHREEPEVRAWLDAGKREAAAGPGPVPDDAVRTLLAAADILVTDHGVQELSERLGDVAPRSVNPKLVTACITPFGSTGPYSRYRGGDLEIAFLSGLAYLTPRDIARPDTGPLPPPLKMPASLVSIYGGASAAAAALCGLFARGRRGSGSVVDVSMLETLVPTLRREIALCELENRVASRFMRVWRLAPYGVKQCRDGYVFLQVVEKYHWEGLVDMMGRPDWAARPEYFDPEYRFAHRHDIEARLAPWLLTQSKADFAWEAQRRGLPFAPINQPADVAGIPQLQYRRFFVGVTHPDGRRRAVPGAPFHYASGTNVAGEPARPCASGSKTASEASGPLTGLRVIDFGHVWAGPYCAALLGDMGAEVIKVESRHRVDIHRRQGPYAQGTPGIDRSGVWNAQNRGKRSVSLNLATDQGRELARRLVTKADVALENFAPGVMQRLGLDYASLCAAKPDLVMASLSAFGQEGPQRAFVGYGPSLDAWASLDWLTAYEGGAPNALGGMFPDTGSAIHAAAAILAALHHRDRTGEGRYIDVSELEVSSILVADAITTAIGGREPTRCGNRDAHHFPHDCYPCAGEDRWIALSVRDAAAWNGLAMVIGRPQWRSDPTLATSDARRIRAVDIDAAIAAWTRPREADAAMTELQAAGVPAAVAHTPRTLLDDPHLRVRGFFQRVMHPDAGAQSIYGPIWRFSGDQGPLTRPAPVLGADNDYVLRDIVGLTADEYEAMIAAGVIH